MSSKKKLIIAFAIILGVIVSFIGGQVFAKYYTQVKGEGVAEVSNWNFTVNDSSEQVQTINLSSTFNNSTLKENKIAPGTSGSFNIKVDATGSDVGIDYKVQFLNETAKPQNLKFQYNGATYNTLKELESVLQGTINSDSNQKTLNFLINWEWKYETGGSEPEILANDKVDTKNAKEISEYSFEVVVTGTQVEPQAS